MLKTIVAAQSGEVTGARNSWGVRPDGQPLLVVANPTATAVPPVTVVVNWTEELKRLVPAR